MNKRIREIAKQATEDVMRNTPSFLVTNEMWQDKFAELVVKECAYLVNHQQRTTGYTTHAKMLCEEFGIEFKQEDYFGVEE